MLKAFADDIVCVVKNENELKSVINEFELLKGDFNIHLNKKKSQFRWSEWYRASEGVQVPGADCDTWKEETN